MGSDAFAYDPVSRLSSAALIGDITQTPKVYTVSLRDMSGKVIRELTYTPSSQTWSWKKNNVYREGALLASVSATDGIRHYHLDHLGSPRLVTNRCGERVKFFVTNPFGLDATSSQDSERMRFTVHERDLGSLSASLDDMDNMHARSYMPYLGRFLGADLLRGDPYSPQSFNLFAYVQGNPMNRFDPFGLYEEHIDVKEKDPCPGAPEGWSCGAWDAFLSLFRLQYWFGLGGTSSATGGPGYKPGGGSGPQQPVNPNRPCGGVSNAESGRPDFVAVNGNVAIPNPWTATLVGVTVQASIDRYGRLYVGLGPNFGKAASWVSGSITPGSLNQLTTPNSQKLEGYLSAWNFNVMGGYGGGGLGVGWTRGSGFATETGFISPQIGISATFSVNVGCVSQGW